MIAPEGWPFVLIPAFAGVVLTVFGEPYPGWVLFGLGVLALLLYRDPVRSCGGSPQGVCAPVDGRVMLIEDTPEEPGLCLRMAVSWRDVYVVRAPQRGVLERVEHHQGRVRSVWSTVTGPMILTLGGRRPLAPIVDRQPGDESGCADRIGLLALGGEAELRLPSWARLQVEAGDRVRAGRTTLAIARESEVA